MTTTTAPKPAGAEPVTASTPDSDRALASRRIGEIYKELHQLFVRRLKKRNEIREASNLTSISRLRLAVLRIDRNLEAGLTREIDKLLEEVWALERSLLP